MEPKKNSRWRPVWTLVLLLAFAALTVTDDRVQLTSDVPVDFTWHEDFLSTSNQGGPDPVDFEFSEEFAGLEQEGLTLAVTTETVQVALDIPDAKAIEQTPDAADELANEPAEVEIELAAKEEPVPEVKPLLVTHKVERGETLWDIAKAYEIDIDTIVAVNELNDPQRLQVGQQLTILTIKGALHTVSPGDNLWDIARVYQVKTQDIVDANQIANPSALQIGQRLVIPGAQAAAAQRYQLVSNGQLRRAFAWPTQGRISSRFGSRWGSVHYGLDIAVPTGTPVRAAADGRVTWSGARGTYGILIMLDHGNRVETRYAHNSRVAVKAGERVKRGQIIAYSGNTGRSTGPHLHFEIRYRGTAVDPEKYLIR
ncbi:MAG: peptidoglycan DD-metalloendopeptidase family protein [Firmicutes bacterium]|nr:peptidoglycan DD-metalloendopeptidase family protein [Bacillota bacterium]